MNKYQEIVSLFKDNDISVVEKETHDPQSGWTGKNMFIRDPKGFLNIDWNYSDEPVWGTIDLSGNGYCFDESSVGKAAIQIKNFYKYNKIETFSDLKEFLSMTAEKSSIT